MLPTTNIVHTHIVHVFTHTCPLTHGPHYVYPKHTLEIRFVLDVHLFALSTRFEFFLQRALARLLVFVCCHLRVRVQLVGLQIAVTSSIGGPSLRTELRFWSLRMVHAIVTIA